MFIDYVACP